MFLNPLNQNINVQNQILAKGEYFCPLVSKYVSRKKALESAAMRLNRVCKWAITDIDKVYKDRS